MSHRLKNNVTNHFAGPFLKLVRANHHIEHLEKIFGEFEALEDKRIRSQRVHDGIRSIGNLPVYVSAILGDAVHNLRVALDHAYALLTVANGGTPGRRTMFPTGTNLAGIKSRIGGQSPEHHPSQTVVDFILKEFEPIPDGKLSLYELHRLDIQDKHTSIIMIASPLLVDRIRFQNPSGTSGPFENFTVVGGFPFAGPDDKLTEDSRFSISVQFASGEFAKQEVLSTLKMLAENVRKCLTDLSKL